jgi:hypothetical protein
VHRLNNHATEGSPHFPHSLTLVTCLLPSSRPIPYRPRGFRVAGGVPPGRRGPHWWEGGIGDRTRTHRLTRGCVWHLQTTRLEMKAPRPSRSRSRQTPRSSRWTLWVSMAGGEGREEGKRGGEGELGDRTRTHGLSRGGVKPWALGCRLFVCVGF